VPSTESNSNIIDIAQTQITVTNKTRGRKGIMTAKLSSALDC